MRDLSKPLAPTYSTSKEGNSRKKTRVSRGGKKTKVVNYTYSLGGGNKKTTTVTKKGKKGTTSKTKTKKQKAGKINRAVQRAQRGSIVKKASKANTNSANIPTNSYISNAKVK